ncbi:MAG TPA: phosphate ABC transporter ATP-binding protein PstB [Pseudogracilibacillus sp.]|nr:phosphate ABC transporter ATP-binding protein PstB [Pseudogracilibacillus sp.]
MSAQVKVKEAVSPEVNYNIELLQRNREKTETIYETKQLHLYYGDTHALKGIDLKIPKHKVTAIIGPSGCGKSTFLKTLNRMTELIGNVRTTGTITFNGQSIFHPTISVEQLRTQVGMVFQKANPFPKSIYENVAYGPKIHGIKDKLILDEIVERSLRDAYLWDEVKDRLNDHAFRLSGGQQQRLCIARTLAIEPEVILMDEPTSALDPKSTLKVEQLIASLKEKYTIIIVTHNMQQAHRISDQTAFFLDGEIIEANDTDIIFNEPEDRRTTDYINGRFG